MLPNAVMEVLLRRTWMLRWRVEGCALNQVPASFCCCSRVALAVPAGRDRPGEGVRFDAVYRSCGPVQQGGWISRKLTIHSGGNNRPPWCEWTIRSRHQSRLLRNARFILSRITPRDRGKGTHYTSGAPAAVERPLNPRGHGLRRRRQSTRTDQALPVPFALRFLHKALDLCARVRTRLCREQELLSLLNAFRVSGETEALASKDNVPGTLAAAALIDVAIT